MDFPKRKRNRLPHFSYSASGAYFVTICTSPRRNVFWSGGANGEWTEKPPDAVGADIIRPLFPLTRAGKAVDQAIRAIPDHYANVDVDCFCIMPDHVHLLVLYAADENGRMISAPTLSTVIGSMKRAVTRQLGRSVWQKSFYDRVIRTEEEFNAACRYIAENPAKWREDRDGGFPFPDGM